MVADAVTKLAAALVLEMARRAMEGQFPSLPGPNKVVRMTDDTWWGAMLMAPHQPVRAAMGTSTTARSTKPSAAAPLIVAAATVAVAPIGEAWCEHGAARRRSCASQH